MSSNAESHQVTSLLFVLDSVFLCVSFLSLYSALVRRNIKEQFILAHGLRGYSIVHHFRISANGMVLSALMVDLPS